MELKDYIHLYIGGKCAFSDGQIVTLDCHIASAYKGEIKPILRRLEDMTEGELMKLVGICYRSIYDEVGSFKNVSKVENDAGIICYDNSHKAADGNDYRYGLTVMLPRGIEFSVNGDTMTIPVFDLQLELYKMGLDIHGLIDSGLALDLKTLNA